MIGQAAAGWEGRRGGGGRCMGLSHTRQAALTPIRRTVRAPFGMGAPKDDSSWRCRRSHLWSHPPYPHTHTLLGCHQRATPACWGDGGGEGGRDQPAARTARTRGGVAAVGRRWRRQPPPPSRPYPPRRAIGRGAAIRSEDNKWTAWPSVGATRAACAATRHWGSPPTPPPPPHPPRPSTAPVNHPPHRQWRRWHRPSSPPPPPSHPPPSPPLAPQR